MLKRMGIFKRRRSNKPPIAEANELDEQFAKVDVSNSSIGDSKGVASGRSASSLNKSPSSRSSTEKEIAHAWEGFDGPAQSSVPSLASDRSCAVRTASPVPTIPLHYELYALPEPTVSGKLSSKRSCDSFDSFDEPEQTLDTSTSFLLDATPPRAPRQRKEAAVELEAGLTALFEKPSLFNSHSGPSPSEPIPLKIRSDDSKLFGPPLQGISTATPDISSHHLLVTGSSAHELPSDTELQSSQVHVPPVKPLLTLTPPPVQSSTKPTRPLDSGTSRIIEDEPSPSQKIALAQVFMYQARMTGQPPERTKKASAITDENISFGSKTSGPRLSSAARAEARRPRSASTSSIITNPDSSLSYDKSMVPQPLHIKLTTPELDGSCIRRNVVDSEAWRRKSRMLQLDSFGNHTRIVA
ncbi:uncharacterized protein GGS22DRAFT_79787 [Annulohypoxylon maeteangense]|uniref:uncharacterized protein n=1 Tax=Annulohypoxylon maeteangense TaxID=1927788 RepID=UPI0020084D7E|nr:uncharacterized protein GGS22DRAFT_79787 [Annulohypoxylon maeteangense]KAI0880760.1 hypothetical protein GGS22DRAFT_79787 [Annulohypoxylon maeteangense]